MTCHDVRLQLLDYQRARLSTQLQEDVRIHLDTCSMCEHEVAAEVLLTEALEHRLPQHAAPPALKRQLATLWPPTPREQPSRWALWRRSLVPALATAAVLLISVSIYYERTGQSPSGRWVRVERVCAARQKSGSAEQAAAIAQAPLGAARSSPRSRAARCRRT